MCISAAQAEFFGTKGYIGEINHPIHGQIHVLGYQNSAKNLSSGPNALILHIPSKELMTKENAIHVGEGCRYLDSIIQNYFDWWHKPNSVTNSRGISVNSSDVEIFSHGIYDIALSAKPSLINDALKEFPEEKRPKIHPDLLGWYEKQYPGWTVAVCCFNNKDVKKSEPMFWWYKPLDENNLHFPAIDAHDGELPKKGEVRVDHKIVASSDRFEVVKELPAYSKFLLRNTEPMPIESYQKNMLPETARPFFGEAIIGKEFSLMLLKNGDFGIPVKDLRKQRNNISRVHTI